MNTQLKFLSQLNNLNLSPTLRNSLLDIHPVIMFSAPEPYLIQGEYTCWDMIQHLTPFERTRRFILFVTTLLSVCLGLVGVMEDPTYTAYATLVVTLLTFYRVVIFDLFVVDIKHTNLPKAGSYSRI